MSEHDQLTTEAIGRDLLLERLVSGGLTRNDERDFLARCELEPDLARAAVFAFVEDRRLAAVLRAEPHGGATAMRREMAPAGPSSRWLSFAAALALLAFGAFGGYELRARRATDVTGTDPTNGSAAVPARADHDELAIAAREFAALAKPSLSSTARQSLREAGIDIQEEPTLYVVSGRNGEQWAIPEKQVRIRFVKDE